MISDYFVQEVTEMQKMNEMQDQASIQELEISKKHSDPLFLILDPLTLQISDAELQMQYAKRDLLLIPDDLEPLYWMQLALVQLESMQQQISSMKDSLKEGYDHAIEERIMNDCWELGDFVIAELVKQGARKVNKDLFMSTHQDIYHVLLDAKVQTLEETYMPTIKDIEALLGTRAHEFIIPGKEISIGYEIRAKGREEV